MKIMHTMASEANATRPKRRFYSSELKAQVMRECRQSGASVAGVALSHGINANIVHRWLREPTQSALVTQLQANAFVPVTIDEIAPGPMSQAQCAPDIRVQVRRANTTIVVKWPLQGSDACDAWLREWLK
ncbi:MAG: transposase [Polaromonas sp.]|uniref:IS66-like element accessory protein TnpA n=1 Tax=Polaromonas sp. TaxID=1869339 RepID=UPI0027373A5A|nr:transposase [Polaromonas sp.]MDP3799790.1 transposase [Polaromonas sp.]